MSELQPRNDPNQVQVQKTAYPVDPQAPPVTTGDYQARVLARLNTPLTTQQKVFLYLTGQDNPEKMLKKTHRFRKGPLVAMVVGQAFGMYFFLHSYVVWKQERLFNDLLVQRSELREEYKALQSQLS